MRKITSFSRIIKLIKSVIDDIGLDLSGIVVLTEAASGPFVVTPLIAAMAGAEHVIAVTKDSRYGTAKEIRQYTNEWACKCRVRGRIEVTFEKPHSFASSVSLITNLGFVRPIDDTLIRLLPPDAAIALMWEPWEFRREDLDLDSCRMNNIPVLGTNESHPRLQIFRYVGMLVLKLLFEANLEVFNSSILLIGSGIFGSETEKTLLSNGATVMHLDPSSSWKPRDKFVEAFLDNADAVVIVEHQATFAVIGGNSGVPLKWLEGKDLKLVHVCGQVDNAIESIGLEKFPPNSVPSGFMTVTTDYVGPRPVVDLHAAGLRVGADLVRGMRLYGATEKAIAYTLQSGLALDF